MPAPQSSLMKQLARTKFSGNQIKVPDQWQQPSGDGAAHLGKALKDNEKSTSPGVAVPPLFTPQSMNKYHTDAQKMLTAEFGGFLDKTADAICSAWGQWQMAAALTGVMIAGPTASLGQVVGPPLTPLILKSMPMTTPAKAKYSKVIANVIGTAWQTYTATIKVPGLPWYPAFAAVPSPVAPPMPNVPVPVIALTQVTAALQPAVMKNQMIAQLADPQAMYHKELFDAITDAFDKMFLTWQTTTMVTKVMGTGPVPSFAPPYAPVGPVVGGTANMIPGGFT